MQRAGFMREHGRMGSPMVREEEEEERERASMTHTHAENRERERERRRELLAIRALARRQKSRDKLTFFSKGQGKCYIPDGSFHEGNWVDGLLQGKVKQFLKGTKDSENGVFEGEFEQGQRKRGLFPFTFFDILLLFSQAELLLFALHAVKVSCKLTTLATKESLMQMVTCVKAHTPEAKKALQLS